MRKEEQAGWIGMEGGPSPQSIDADVKKDQYGSAPQDSEITAWIRQTAESCLA